MASVFERSVRHVTDRLPSLAFQELVEAHRVFDLETDRFKATSISTPSTLKRCIVEKA